MRFSQAKTMLSHCSLWIKVHKKIKRLLQTTAYNIIDSFILGANKKAIKGSFTIKTDN